MVDEPKDVAAPVEAPKTREPQTAVQWLDKFHALVDEGKADGLNPMQLLAGEGLKLFTGGIEGLLAVVLDTSPAKKK